MNRSSKLIYWQFECVCELCSLSGGDLKTNENLRKDIIKIDDKELKFVTEIIAVQNNSARMSEDD